MPAVNPFIDPMAPGGATASTSDAAPVVQQAFIPAAITTGIRGMNPFTQGNNATNAAGTAENVALHMAVIVAFAMIGVYVLQASGFKFVVAGSVGGSIGR